MKADAFLQYIDEQKSAIEAVIGQLDEVQIAFNAQFDSFKALHDALLDQLTDQIAERYETAGLQVRTAVEERLPEETRVIEERCVVISSEYLPRRQQAADEVLAQAQAQMAELRALNPELDGREEELKQQRLQLEALLQARNDEIARLSRVLGVITHFVAITKADRERQRLIGKLEMVNDALLQVRKQWQTERDKAAAKQAELQEKWQLESIAVARLQAELDQLGDEQSRESLAFRRAVRYVVDSLKAHSASPDPDLDARLREMVELNIQTDSYHDGLASVGGLIGLLRGILSGLEAVRRSVQGLADEQRMHSAYLKPLSFELPSGVDAFHQQWAQLSQQFEDEQVIGEHPAEFSAAIAPLLVERLSQTQVESMFSQLGQSIEQAAAAW